MAYPILAPSNTWFTPTNSSVTRSVITEIEIMDSYTPDSSVTVVDSWDASEAKDGSITCYVIGTKLIMAGNGSGKISANTDCSKMLFANWNDYFSAITKIIGLYLLDTSYVTNMQGMFWGGDSLTSLDLSGWDVSNVINMSLMFNHCLNLVSLNVTGWDTKKVTTMSGFFQNTNVLESVIGLSDIDTSSVVDMSSFFKASKISDIPDFNTSRVENMSYMFNGYLGEMLIIPNWDTSNVTNMERMFSSTTTGKCLKQIDASNLDTSKVTTMKDMFYCQDTIETIIISNFNFSNVVDASNMFFGCSSVKNIIFPDRPINFAMNAKLGAMFLGCSKLESINTSNWNVSTVSSMADMFYGCSSIDEIDVSNWSMPLCTNMSCMFQNCSLLTGLDVSNWNTSSCIDMSFMFYGCSSLKKIDVSNWNVSKVTTFDHFAAHANLKRKGIENWKTTSATNMNALFHNCAEEELDLSGWDVSKVQFFCQMFENSPNLKRIKGLEKWNTSAGLGFDGMFERCYKLEEVDLSAFNTTKAKNGTTASTNDHKTATLQNMFLSCNNLKKVILGPNFAINGNGSNTSAANKLILPTPSTDYIESADGNWYSIGGTSYTPSGIPDRTACVYFASRKLIEDQDVIIPNKVLLDIAAALREVNGSTNKYKPENFSEAILALKA